jgi:hypothetical protein
MHAAAAADTNKTRQDMLLTPFQFASSLQVVAADIKIPQPHDRPPARAG